MNKEKFDFNECEQSLTNTSLIQNYGALAWISKRDSTTHYVSENLPNVLGLELEEIQAGNAESLVGSAIWKLMQDTPEGVSKDVSFSDDFTIIYQTQSAGWLVEWLPEQRLVQNNMKYPVTLATSLSESQAINEVLKRIADEAGFERAMLYRFLPDGSGDVVAEIYQGNGDHYLGLRYPATDIPQVARDLYLKCNSRFIFDVNGANDRVLPLTDSDKPLDLTYSFLRSVSPFHISYLKNMNIGCAYSLALIRNESLWGLISLHHPEPKHISPYLRHRFEQLGDNLMRHLRMQDSAARMKYLDKHQTLINTFYESLLRPSPVSKQVQAEVLQFLDADSFAFYTADGWVKMNDCPDDNTLDAIALKLITGKKQGFYQTDCLSVFLESAKPYAHCASGLVAVWFPGNGPVVNDSVCFWFRREAAQDVTWGSKVEANASSLNPHNSFGAWKEKMLLHSQPWTQEAVLTAEAVLARRHLAA